MLSVFQQSASRFPVASNFLLQSVRNATKKAGGTVKNGRDSIGKRLGVKKFGGEKVIPGNIIIRQRGKTYHPGFATKCGRDYTLYAMTEGWVKFDWDKDKRRQIVSVSDINPHLPNMHKQRVENIVKATGMSFKEADELVKLALGQEQKEEEEQSSISM